MPRIARRTRSRRCWRARAIKATGSLSASWSLWSSSSRARSAESSATIDVSFLASTEIGVRSRDPARDGAFVERDDEATVRSWRLAVWWGDDSAAKSSLDGRSHVVPTHRERLEFEGDRPALPACAQLRLRRHTRNAGARFDHQVVKAKAESDASLAEVYLLFDLAPSDGLLERDYGEAISVNDETRSSSDGSTRIKHCQRREAEA